MSGDSPTRRRDEIARDNRALLTKLGVVVVAMFGFGYALVPFYDQICEVTGLRDIDAADTRRQHAGRHDAHRAHRVRRQPAQPAVAFRRWRPRRRASGRGDQVEYEVVNTHRPPDHRAGDAELRAAARRRSISRSSNASASRSRRSRRGETRQHAGGVRRRPEAAEGRDTITLSYTFFEVEGNAGLTARESTAGVPASASEGNHGRQESRMSTAAAGAKPYYFVPQPSHWPIIGLVRAAADGLRRGVLVQRLRRRARGSSLAGFCVLLT